MSSIYDVIIIGGGPAGLTAGLYTSRAKLNTLILEKESVGGELTNRDTIENYPGYPEGIQGPELGSRMVEQATKYGAEIQIAEVTRLDNEGTLKSLKTREGNYLCKAIIIAGGSRPKKLGIPGEQEFTGRGVIYCATCDGPAFAGKEIAVAGGGNSGLTEALFLSKIASKVTVVELLPCLGGDKILQERVLGNPKIEVRCGVKIERILGDSQVQALDITDIQSGQKAILKVSGLLVHIGLDANTDFLKGNVPLSQSGQVLVDRKFNTEIPGILAAGDICHNSPMQIATAVGDGASAALSLEKYLASL